MSVLDAIAAWPVDNVAAAVVGPRGVRAAYGDQKYVFPLASVTKPLIARVAQVAVEEGVFDLDTPAGPPGATIRHLLAHASGVAVQSAAVLAAPGSRRVYSNYGFTLLAEALEAESGIHIGDYLREGLLEPLSMADTTLAGGAPAAGYGAASTVADIAAFAVELLRPALVSDRMHAQSTTVQFPGLAGVLPGFGVQRPNDWGLGVEVKSAKAPHWTGRLNSPSTYGHFGRSGTFLWVDPSCDVALVVLTDRAFGDWTHACWPALSDTVVAEYGAD